jgi:hypothetical protein
MTNLENFSKTKSASWPSIVLMPVSKVKPALWAASASARWLGRHPELIRMIISGPAGMGEMRVIRGQ